VLRGLSHRALSGVVREARPILPLCCPQTPNSKPALSGLPPHNDVTTTASGSRKNGGRASLVSTRATDILENLLGGMIISKLSEIDHARIAASGVPEL